MKPGEHITERWQTEAAFFDRQAETNAKSLAPIDERVLRRYQEGATIRALYALEYAIAIAGPLKGRRILDVGCGEGQNAVLLAKLGAHVTGVDISPGAIALAREAARINRIENVTEFLVSPIEALDHLNDQFDIVWCEALLHHVIPVLPKVVANLRSWVKASGLIVMVEPTNLFPPLRWLRQLIPVAIEATPGERPLERGELNQIRQILPDLSMRHFRALGRMSRFLIQPYTYETAGVGRRAVADILARLDHGLLELPGFSRLGSVTVMHSRINDRIPEAGGPLA